MKQNTILALGLLLACNAGSIHGRAEVLTGASTANSANKNELLVFDGADGTLLREGDYASGASVVAFAAKFSPDGRFIAAGGVASNGMGGDFLRIYVNDPNSGALTEIDSFDHGNRIDSVDWSSDGDFIAIGGFADSVGVEVQVLPWDGTTLGAPIDFANDDEDVRSVAWSPDGQFLAIGDGTGVLSGRVRVLSFDGATLTHIDTFEVTGLARVRSVDWSPDGRFIAIGTSFAGGPDPEVRVLEFDGTNLADTGAAFEYGRTVLEVAWSTDGTYIAMAGARRPGVSGSQVRVLEFDRDASSLATVATFSHGPTEAFSVVFSVEWYPDCSRIAMGGSLVNGINVRGLDFDADAGTLTPFFNANHGDDVLSVDVAICGVDLFDVNVAISNCHKLLVNDICPVFADCPNLADPQGTTNFCGNAAVTGPDACLRVNNISPVDEATCEEDRSGTTCLTGRVGVPCLVLTNNILPIKDCKPDLCGNLCLYGCVTARNDFKVLGDFSRPSDERIKRNIVPIDAQESLAAICALQPQSYEFTEAWQQESGVTGRQRGFIAQEVANVLPELVHEYAPQTAQNLQAIDYTALVVDLVSSMQALKHKVTRLQAELEG